MWPIRLDRRGGSELANPFGPGSLPVLSNCNNVAAKHNPTEADIREYFWSLVDKNGPLPDPATGVNQSAGSALVQSTTKVMATSWLGGSYK